MQELACSHRKGLIRGISSPGRSCRGSPPAAISHACGTGRRRAVHGTTAAVTRTAMSAITVTAAPAQDITRMFTAPSVNDLGGHLKIVTMLAPIFDQRAEVIDEFSGSVVSDVRGAGERLMVYRPAGGDRAGQAGPRSLPCLSRNSSESAEYLADWHPRETGRPVRLPPLTAILMASISGRDPSPCGKCRRLRAARRPRPSDHARARDPGGEDYGCLPACAPQGVQHVEPVERVLDGVVVPGKVGHHTSNLKRSLMASSTAT